MLWGYGGMADATDSKSVLCKWVRVQVPLSPVFTQRKIKTGWHKISVKQERQDKMGNRC